MYLGHSKWAHRGDSEEKFNQKRGREGIVCAEHNMDDRDSIRAEGSDSTIKLLDSRGEGGRELMAYVAVWQVSGWHFEWFRLRLK